MREMGKSIRREAFFFSRDGENDIFISLCRLGEILKTPKRDGKNLGAWVRQLSEHVPKFSPGL